MSLPVPAALGQGTDWVFPCCLLQGRFILTALSPGLLQSQDGSVVLWGVQGCGEQSPVLRVGGGDVPQVNPTACYPKHRWNIHLLLTSFSWHVSPLCH